MIYLYLTGICSVQPGRCSTLTNIMNIIIITTTTTIIIIIVIVIIIMIIIPYGDELVLLSDSAFEKPTHLMSLICCILY